MTANPEMPCTPCISANSVPLATSLDKGEGSAFLQATSITRTPVTKVMSSGSNVTFTPHLPLYEPNMTKFAHASDNRGTFEFTQQQAGFPVTSGLNGAALLFNPTSYLKQRNNIQVTSVIEARIVPQAQQTSLDTLTSINNNLPRLSERLINTELCAKLATTQISCPPSELQPAPVVHVNYHAPPLAGNRQGLALPASAATGESTMLNANYPPLPLNASLGVNQGICNIHQFYDDRYLPRPEFTKFNGNPLEFKTFMNDFNKHIVPKLRDPALLLSYLLQHCKPEIRKKLQHFSNKNANGFQLAQERLEKEYGRPCVIADACEQQLKLTKTVQSNDSEGMKRYAETLEKMLITLDDIRFYGSLNSLDTIFQLVNKLPYEGRKQWVRESVKLEKAVRCLIFLPLLSLSIVYVTRPIRCMAAEC